MSEHDEQVFFFDYVRMKANQDPIYKNIIAIPNAAKRSPRHGNDMVREGLAKGFPDVGIFIARGGWHGMFLEFKVKPNKVTYHQTLWINQLRDAGYYPSVVWSGQEGIDLLEGYLLLSNATKSPPPHS